jgi:hypothetical protein
MAVGCWPSVNAGTSESVDPHDGLPLPVASNTFGFLASAAFGS